MNYYDEIKNELINNEVTKKVKDYSKNKSDLTTYYNVGKLLKEAGKHYGEGIIKEYSEKLTADLGTKYDSSTLNKMKKFFEEYYEVSAQIETVDKQNFDITLYDKDSKEKAKGSIVVGEATNSGTYFNNYLVD